LAADNAALYVSWRGLAVNTQIATALPGAVLQADRW